MKRRSFLAIFAVLLPVGVSALAAEPKRPLGVPADAKHFNGRWFQLYGEKITWKNARQRCERLGGRLACIPDAETNQFIKSVADGVIAWLGATDEKTEGRWIWIDGSPVTFKGWRTLPDNQYGRENFLAVWDTGEWNDASDGEKKVAGFICEWKGR